MQADHGLVVEKLHREIAKRGDDTAAVQVSDSYSISLVAVEFSME